MYEKKNEYKDIALALSGGGSRAIAFHLGCLRALNDRGLLGRIRTASSVSGGSVIAATYCLNKVDIQAFEERITAFLKQGLFWPTLKTAFSFLGVLWILSELLMFILSVLWWFFRLIPRVTRWLLGLVGIIVWSERKFRFQLRASDNPNLAH